MGYFSRSAGVTTWNVCGADVFGKFAKSAWGQKLAKRQAKLDKTDFERHQDLVSRRKLSQKTKIIANKLKKQAA